MHELTNIEAAELRALAVRLVATGNQVIAVLDRLPKDATVLVALKVSVLPISIVEQIRIVCSLVAEARGFGLKQLLAPGKCQDVAEARHLCWWACRKATSAPLMQIGRFFDRDHGTVLHGVYRVEELRSVDKNLRLESDRLLAASVKALDTRAGVHQKGRVGTIGKGK